MEVAGPLGTPLGLAAGKVPGPCRGGANAGGVGRESASGGGEQKEDRHDCGRGAISGQDNRKQ